MPNSRLCLRVTLVLANSKAKRASAIWPKHSLSRVLGPFVASLWSADDTSASSLMEQFYKRLADGESVSAALRNAKVDMLSKFGNDLNPYDWAAFISVGETSTPIGIQK